MSESKFQPPLQLLPSKKVASDEPFHLSPLMMLDHHTISPFFDPMHVSHHAHMVPPDHEKLNGHPDGASAFDGGDSAFDGGDGDGSESNDMLLPESNKVSSVTRSTQFK